jgi:hypothetical protein
VYGPFSFALKSKGERITSFQSILCELTQQNQQFAINLGPCPVNPAICRQHRRNQELSIKPILRRSLEINDLPKLTEEKIATKNEFLNPAISPHRLADQRRSRIW